jgi:hypothetical protein
VLDHAAKKKRREPAFGGALDPGDEDDEQEQRKEKLDRVWLNCDAVVDSGGAELSWLYC